VGLDIYPCFVLTYSYEPARSPALCVEAVSVEPTPTHWEPDSEYGLYASF